MYPRKVTDMKLYGLIGFPLEHSYSKKYFNDKFDREYIADCDYRNFEMPTVESLPGLIKSYPNLLGFNVTIPHKFAVMPLLNELDHSAKKVGAVNVVKIKDSGLMVGYNSDYYGFMASLKRLLKEDYELRAMVLGSGGASNAVRVVLKDMGIPFTTISREMSARKDLGEVVTYGDLTAEIVKEHRLIINATPVGMFPDTEVFPDIPYYGAGKQHYFYDLVYNPAVTRFLQIASLKTKHFVNGSEMLGLQAEKAWEIWQQQRM